MQAIRLSLNLFLLLFFLLRTLALPGTGYYDEVGSYLRKRTNLTSATVNDPFDHSWIERWAALGESYATGLGAGQTVDTTTLNVNITSSGGCDVHYDHGYPNWINTDPALGGLLPDRKFQYIGCSGRTIRKIINEQVRKLERPQMVTLSAGGNDAPFSLVLDACVYQWSRSCNKCDSVLAKAKDNVRGEKFAKDLDDLLEAIKDKLDSSSSRIYFVEYGKFFDTTTKQCDKVTWAFKIALGCRQFLTQDRRSAMNELVDEVNSQIKSAVERAGPQAVYVEWQSDMDLIGGRFCEPGVDETQGQDRDQTFFYEWGTHKDDPWKVPTNDLVPLTQSKRSFFQDNSAGLNLMTRSNNETANITGVSPETEGRLADSIVSTVRNGSSKWSNDNNHFGPVASALLNRTFDGTFEDQILAFMKEGAKGTPTENEFVFQDRNGTPVTIALPSGSSAIPAQYARVFHPTRAGHAIIAANVLSAMNDEAAKLLGKPSASTTILIQPTPTGPGSFQGVKVECYNDTKPVTFNFKDANQALWNFCFDHRSESLSGRPAIIGYFPGGSGENAALELKVTHDQSDDCQGVHQWDKINYYDCVGMMQQAMWDCPANILRLKGGKEAQKCLDYSIRGVHMRPGMLNATTINFATSSGSQTLPPDCGRSNSSCTGTILPASTIPASTTSKPTPSCVPKEDPDAGQTEASCMCSGYPTLLPTIKCLHPSAPSCNICGYRQLPAITSAPTTTSTTTSGPYAFSMTDFSNGQEVGCYGATSLTNNGYTWTGCAGSSTTYSTDASVTSYESSVLSTKSTASTASTFSATPTATCKSKKDIFYYRIDITGINGWGGPDGAWLHGNESGCGGLTDWSWNLDPDGKNSARFNLAPIVKHGCAGRAIGSAGGPQIEC